MNKRIIPFGTYSVLATLTTGALFNPHPSQAGNYSFGGNCPSQGAWTQMALQQSQEIASAVRQLKDNPACKGITGVVQNLEAATSALSVSKDEVNLENRAENLPGEMGALRNNIMKSGSPDLNASSMLLGRTIEAAALSSEISSTADHGNQASIANAAKSGLSNLFSKYAAPTQKGLDLITNVINVLPQYDECLIGQPRAGMAIIGGAVKVAAAFSAAGEGVGDKLGNSIAALTQMMADRRFTLALRKLDETEFWFSISCLLEGTTKNYCEAENAQEILKYSSDQYAEAMKRNLQGRKNADYDNPLEGYYLLVRELPVISAWLQQVQFGVTPKLSTDAKFKNDVWDQVTDLTKSVNSLKGFFNEQILFMRGLTDINAKRNHVIENIIGPLVTKMAGDQASPFFTTTVNPTLLPFYLIGRDSIPAACRVSEGHMVAESWQDWMKTSSPDGTFSADFADPEKLAITIEARMNDLIAGASAKSSAYFRQRLVVDMPNLVNQTITGQYMTVRKSFENVFNYLVRFENRLSKDNMDLILIPSVRETKTKIMKFMNSYDDLRKLGETMVKTTGQNEALLKKVDAAAQKVIDTTFDEFNMLLQKDTFLTTRLTTFIEKDFSMRVHAGQNMSAYQQDILTITQKHLLEKLTEVHGLNPTNSQIDLARAQMINKRNIESIEDVFGDTIYHIIVSIKSIADGKGDAGIQAELEKKFKAERAATRWAMMALPTAAGGGFFSWLFAGPMIRNAHPDLYGSNTGSRITGRDDQFKSFSQMQALFCSQTLAFEDRGAYQEICKGSVLKSYYPKAIGKGLDLEYNDYLATAADAGKVRRNPELAGKNVCAYQNFMMRNLVQWLRDQDAEMYDDNSIQ